MENLILSKNGLYLLNKEKIYSVVEEKSYSYDEITIDRWIDILSEISQFSIKNTLVEIKDIMSYHRRVTYQIFSDYSTDLKTKLMLEYETKFSGILLTENISLLENWVTDAWKWTKEKAGQVGNWVVDKVKNLGSFAVKTGKDFITCVTGKGCSPLFEDFREMLFSPVGITIEVFLTTTGIGAIAPMIAWGIMLCWDSYLLVSGDPTFSWLNLIFDILGVGLGAFAKAARSMFQAAGITKVAGKNLPEVVRASMSNPKTAGIMKRFGKIASEKLPQIQSAMSSAGKFLSEKLGIKWISKVLNSITGQISKILEAIGIVAKKGTTHSGVNTALRTGVIAQGVLSGAHAINNAGRQKELQATQAQMKGIFDADIQNMINDLK